MPKRFARLAAVLLAAVLLAPSVAWACRVPLRPEALRTMEADAIVLVQVANVELVDERWMATASILGTLSGAHPTGQITFSEGPWVSCYQPREPRPGRYYVLFLERSEDGFRFLRVFPYWFARRSGDVRLTALNDLLPLGAAREPTPEESRLIGFAEPRVAAQTGISDLSGYTRIYARSSKGSVTAVLFKSETAERSMVDSSEELPTEESCGCDPITVFVDLDDLWDAGELPAFNP